MARLPWVNTHAKCSAVRLAQTRHDQVSARPFTKPRTSALGQKLTLGTPRKLSDLAATSGPNAAPINPLRAKFAYRIDGRAVRGTMPHVNKNSRASTSATRSLRRRCIRLCHNDRFTAWGLEAGARADDRRQRS